MFNLLSFTSVLFTFVLLDVMVQERVEGIKWTTHGGIRELSVMSEAFNLLDELYEIPRENITRLDDIMDLIFRITTKMKPLYKSIYKKNNVFLNLVNNERFPIKFDFNRLNEKIEYIRKRYMKMIDMAKNLDEYEDFSKKKFSKNNVNSTSKDSVLSTLTSAFDMLLNSTMNTGKVSTSLLGQISSGLRGNKSCSSFPDQDFFFWKYLEMSMVEIQGYLVNKFSWSILGASESIVFNTQEEEFIQNIKMRSTALTELFRTFVVSANREISRCDPPKWEEKVNYEQLTRLFQGYIVNEVSLSDTHTCSETCPHYKNTKVSCYEEDRYCTKSAGKILSCEQETSFDNFEICHSTNSARRFDYLIVNRNYLYGKPTSCERYRKTFTQSWMDLLNFVTCCYCFCLIDEKSKYSDRFFNLREVLSDVDKNKVVTGVRFVKKNRIIYLQIQQGELAPFGLIKENTTAWKDVELYEMKKENEGIDYITFDSDRKSINLDNVQAINPRYIVTGVKLSIDDSHLYLTVQVTEYKFEEGKLVDPLNTSEWIFNDWPHKMKVPLETTDGPRVSTLAPGNSISSPDGFDYVEFTHSSKKHDAAQTTLPFIDSQDVVSPSISPLSGVGLYYKGFYGYGGFIAPKIFAAKMIFQI